MGRTLFTLSFVADCDEETRAELLRRMETQFALQMLSTLEQHDKDFEDLAEAGLEFYGISVAPMRETV